MKATTTRRMFLTGVLMAMLTSAAMAQSYYDDDIYFDADKAKKEKAEKAAKAAKAKAEAEAAEEAHMRYLESIVDTEAGSDRAVDEYNRRSGYKPAKEQSTDLGDNFTYTRRIEQFSNPGIVVNSNDDDLKYYYVYANDELAGATGTTSPTTINIYVDNTDPWDNFWSPYYYASAWSWAWRPTYSYYNPWWGYNYWGYGPSWSWSWGYDHLWGPSWSWGWHHGPNWGWGWNPPRPPHHPTKPQPGYRPGNSGFVPGGRGGRSGGRTTSGGNNSSNVGRRPTTPSSSTQHSVSGQVHTPNRTQSGVSTTGRRTSSGSTYNSSNSGRSTSSGSNYNSSNSGRTSSGSNYNNTRSSSSGSSYNSRSTSGSTRSSSGSTRSTSGSTRSGGGGRSGGRR